MAAQIVYLWTTPGDKRITVTATNATATVSQALTITIGVEPPKALYLPIVAGSVGFEQQRVRLGHQGYS